MAEDAVESAGAKAPTITISIQQIIAGEGGLMSDDRCAAVHPKLGLRCERLKKHCNGPGIDHTAKREDGTHALWPNPHGTTAMHVYFRSLLMGKRAMVETRKEEDMRSTNEKTDQKERQPSPHPACPTCSTPLDLQSRDPLLWFCAWCRKWLDESLKPL